MDTIVEADKSNQLNQFSLLWNIIACYTLYLVYTGVACGTDCRLAEWSWKKSCHHLEIYLYHSTSVHTVFDIRSFFGWTRYSKHCKRQTVWLNLTVAISLQIPCLQWYRTVTLLLTWVCISSTSAICFCQQCFNNLASFPVFSSLFLASFCVCVCVVVSFFGTISITVCTGTGRQYGLSFLLVPRLQSYWIWQLCLQRV